MKKIMFMGMALFSLCFLQPAFADDEYSYVSKIGSASYDNGGFWQSWGIAADNGFLYVTDNWLSRITKLKADGTFVLKWGDGIAPGQLNNPNGVAVDQAGNVYIADTGNQQVQKFTSNGVFITKWGSSGAGDGQFNNPIGIAVDATGNVYVTDRDNDRIQIFTSDGAFITKWGSLGTGDGQFGNPAKNLTRFLAGIAVDSAGYVYVTDYLNYRVQKFTSNGVFVAKWGSFGTGNGQFGGTQPDDVGPEGIAVDQAGYVYVTDAGNLRIQKFNSDGIYVTQWKSRPSPDDLVGANNIAVDQACNVFTVDEHSGAGMNLKFSSNSMSCCKTTVDKALNVYLPAIQYGGSYWWANLGQLGGGLTFSLSSAGANNANAFDSSQFHKCTPAILSYVPNTATVPNTQDLILDIQSLEYHNAEGNNINYSCKLKNKTDSRYPGKMLFDVSVCR